MLAYIKYIWIIDWVFGQHSQLISLILLRNYDHVTRYDMWAIGKRWIDSLEQLRFLFCQFAWLKLRPWKILGILTISHFSCLTEELPCHNAGRCLFWHPVSFFCSWHCKRPLLNFLGIIDLLKFMLSSFIVSGFHGTYLRVEIIISPPLINPPLRP